MGVCQDIVFRLLIIGLTHHLTVTSFLLYINYSVFILIKQNNFIYMEKKYTVWLKKSVSLDVIKDGNRR